MTRSSHWCPQMSSLEVPPEPLGTSYFYLCHIHRRLDPATSTPITSQVLPLNALRAICCMKKLSNDTLWPTSLSSLYVRGLVNDTTGTYTLYPVSDLSLSLPPP